MSQPRILHASLLRSLKADCEVLLLISVESSYALSEHTYSGGEY